MSPRDRRADRSAPARRRLYTSTASEVAGQVTKSHGGNLGARVKGRLCVGNLRARFEDTIRLQRYGAALFTLVDFIRSRVINPALQEPHGTSGTRPSSGLVDRPAVSTTDGFFSVSGQSDRFPSPWSAAMWVLQRAFPRPPPKTQAPHARKSHCRWTSPRNAAAGKSVIHALPVITVKTFPRRPCLSPADHLP